MRFMYHIYIHTYICACVYLLAVLLLDYFTTITITIGGVIMAIARRHLQVPLYIHRVI